MICMCPKGTCLFSISLSSLLNFLCSYFRSSQSFSLQGFCSESHRVRVEIHQQHFFFRLLFLLSLTTSFCCCCCCLATDSFFARNTSSVMQLNIYIKETQRACAQNQLLQFTMPLLSKLRLSLTTKTSQEPPLLYEDYMACLMVCRWHNNQQIMISDHYYTSISLVKYVFLIMNVHVQLKKLL